MVKITSQPDVDYVGCDAPLISGRKGYMKLMLQETTSLLLAIYLIAGLVGCTPPPPASTASAPPPPPPPSAPEAKPPPPPAEPAPDPYDTKIEEVGKILQRYAAVYAGIRDEASADKAVEEIGRLTARLRELAGELAEVPYRPEQEKQTVMLQTELARVQTASLTNQEIQGVLADPDLAIRLLTAQQSFLLEGVAAVIQAIVSRQPGQPQRAPTKAPAI